MIIESKVKNSLNIDKKPDESNIGTAKNLILAHIREQLAAH